MAGVAVKPSNSELVVDFAGQRVRTELVLERYRLGRGAANELAFPEDSRLSREHLVFQRNGNGCWEVRDCGSSNGTRLNGKRICDAVALKHGDRIAAGSLSIIFHTSSVDVPTDPVVLFESPTAHPKTISTDLGTALRSGMHAAKLQNRHLEALLRAGRELARYRGLKELFDLVLDLSVSAVDAGRGVLIAWEAGALTVRSSRGERFTISTVVRDRVLAGESLLIADALSTEDLASRESIMAYDVRSILAVPLQTEAGVLGLIYVDSPHTVRRFTPDDLSLLTVMANIAAIRLEHARLLEVEQTERQLARELDQAAEIQSKLLPSGRFSWPDLDVAGYNTACRKVGGDYYDFWRYSDGRLAVMIADVSGKGMPAALLMSNLHACAHAIFQEPGQLTTRVCQLNRAIALSTPMTSFITFFIALIDPANDVLTYCNAGHNPPILLHSSGEVERLEGTGMVLGMFPDTKYEEVTCAFRCGDGLLLFSDGVSESCEPGTANEFGDERLIEVFKASAGAPAQSVIERVNSAVKVFTRGAAAADDMTLAVVHRC